MCDRFQVLGVGISAVDLDSAAGRILRAARGDRTGYVCVTGAHGVMEARRDPELMRIHNESLLTVPDGMPLVWVARRRRVAGVGRVYGPDLMRRVLGSGEGRAERTEHRVESGERIEVRGPKSEVRSPEASDSASVPPAPVSHFLLGSTPETLDRLEARIAVDHPGARIAGSWSPPFRDLTDDEWTGTLRRVRESGASIVWVGLSTPKQERLMAEFVRKWNAEVRGRRSEGGDRKEDTGDAPTSDFRPPTSVMLVGVGAAFDVLAGLRRDAPGWVKRVGLQWLHRLLQEPQRLGPRYLAVVPGFLWRILPDLILGSRGR